jgi:hypothetical protein
MVMIETARAVEPDYQNSPERSFQADIIRCLAGNPFGHTAFNPEWRTRTVEDLAQGLYEERAFDRLPILADALEEAGCDHEAVLNHFRSDGSHARGCWAVDLITGRA